MNNKRQRIISVCGCVSLLLALTACKQAPKYRVVSTSVVATEPACMPAATRAQNGDILVAYSTVWEPFPPGGTLTLVRSTDQGRTWSEPRVLWKPEPGKGVHLGSGMTTLRDGTILLPCTYCFINKHKNIPLGEKKPHLIYNLKDLRNRREIHLLVSTDNGKTWENNMIYTHPKGQWVLGFGKIIELPDGELIYPCYWGVPNEAQTRNKFRAHGLLRSVDYGKNWKLEQIPWPPPGPNEPYSPWHSEISPTLLSDGRLVIILRNNGTTDWPRRVFAISWSSDGGRSWTYPVSTGVQGKMPELIQLPSGRILMGVGAEGISDGIFVFRNKDRYSFATLFFSDDNGKSWNKDLPFAQAEPGSTILPADSPILVPLDDGKVVVIIQALDRAKEKDPLVGYSVGMHVIANVIEPVEP